MPVRVAVEVGVWVAGGQPRTVVCDVAVLLLKLLSLIESVGFTIAVLTNGERLVHGELTSTMSVIVALLLAGRLPPEQAMTLLGTAGSPQVNPLVPEELSSVMPGGRLSCTVTGKAAVPPALPTVMV